MTRAQAYALIGGRGKSSLRSMARALAKHPRGDSADDWARAQALRVLGYRLKTKRT